MAHGLKEVPSRRARHGEPVKVLEWSMEWAGPLHPEGLPRIRLLVCEACYRRFHGE